MHHTPPVGGVVGGPQITSILGEGGFGIVYRPFDPTLQRHVALKEHMPSSLASRSTHAPRAR
jgi:serine/threonine protein kinase